MGNNQEGAESKFV